MKYLRSRGFYSLLQNKPILLTVTFVFLLGISVGVFSEVLLTPENRSNMELFLSHTLFPSELHDTNLPSVFLRSIAINLGLLLIIILAGITIIGFPAALLVLIYKSVSLGFTSALLIETMGAKGVLTVFLTLVPQNLIYIPSFIIASIASLSLAISLIIVGPKGIKKSLASCAGNFIILYLIIAVFILGGCFIESFISPFLQQISL